MKSKFFLLLTAALLVICGCTDFPREEEAPTGLSVSVVSLSFPETSSTQAITIRSGSKWTVSSIPEWVSVQSIDNKFAFSYEWPVTLVSAENEGYDRNGTIVFSASGETVSVPVEQKGKKGAYVAVESVSLGVSEITLTEGDTYTLTATISPDNASDKSVTWSSSNTDVATVSSSGIVTAIAVGSAMISVRTHDGGKVTSCQVTVQPKIIPVTGIALDDTSLTMTEGETQSLVATVIPDNATDKSVSWYSSNTSVATVSSNGVVTAVSAGTATITAKTTDGGKTATCSVTVKAATIPVTGVSLDKSSLTMTEGDTQTLIATVSPSNATNRSVTWSSNNTSVATVSSSGIVTAVAAGTATITVRTNDGGKTASCYVTVQAKKISVTGVSLDKTNLSLTEGDTWTLNATITPSNATDKSVTWSSNNTTVATVSSSGVVTAKAAGTAKITVTTSDGEKTASCSVSVKAKTISVTGVSLSKTSLSMTVGESQTLTATVTPSNATDKSVRWSSSNPSVATVSSSGLITAVSIGSAIITVTTNDGGLTATCLVTVEAQTIPVENVSLDKTSLSMAIGDTQVLTATITPSDATDKAVTWSSSNTYIATVSSSGVVTAKYLGSATITVTTNDGEKTATCLITVVYPVPEAVDLGLNVKWASFNIGAINPEDSGFYFPWGYTEPIATSHEDFFIFNLESYKWYNKSSGTLSKYCSISSYGQNGYTDNKTVLDKEDDAAYVNLGSKWRIPTKEDFVQLKNNCSWKWTTLNGINGYQVTGPNGNSIFLPAVGFGTMIEFREFGTHGSYWSSSLRTDYPYAAHSFHFGSSTTEVNSRDRACILPIRPVMDKDGSLPPGNTETIIDGGETGWN